MADNIQTSSGGHGGLYFIVGILVVVVGVLAYFFLGGDGPSTSERDVNVNVTTPAPSGGESTGESGSGQSGSGQSGSGQSN